MEAKRLPQVNIVLEVIENLQEVVWARITSGVKKFIKGFMEDLLQEKITAQIGAIPFEWTIEHQGYRNDQYVRDLLTRFGLVGDIRVPRHPLFLFDGCSRSPLATVLCPGITYAA